MRSLAVCILSLAFCSCKSPTSAPSDEPIPVLKVAESVDSVSFELSIPKASWSTADTFKADFRLTNQALSSRTFNFSYAQQWQWSVRNDSDRAIMYYPRWLSPAVTQFTLNPTESKVFSLTQKIADDAGIPVRSGSYRLYANLRHQNSALLNLNLTIQ